MMLWDQSVGVLRESIISGVVTAVALSKMAAGVGLYWGVSSLFGAVQGFVVQRRAQAAV